MAKFYGEIGFVTTIEKRPGVWIPEITERSYKGELVRNTRKLQNTAQVNDNIDIANDISIIADPFAYNNFHSIRYVKFMGSKWRVTSVEVQYPRLVLTIGGVYNGDEA